MPESRTLDVHMRVMNTFIQLIHNVHIDVSILYCKAFSISQNH